MAQSVRQGPGFVMARLVSIAVGPTSALLYGLTLKTIGKGHLLLMYPTR